MAAKYSMLLSVKTLGAQGIKRLGNSMQGLAGKVKNAKLTFDGLAKAYVSLRAVQDTLNKSVQREESIRRLNLLAQGFDNLAAVQTAAGNAAKKFGVSQTQANKEFAQIYARLRPIGLELEDIVTVYEGFNTAAKLSGTSASEASGAFLQLSQALGTGVLRGQELNSVFEQTPAVVQAIAKEMGVTVGEIRDLARQGKVTIDYILPALERLRTEGAEKLTEAMKGPAQQFRNLNIAVEELQIAAIEDNLDGIVTIIQGITEGVKILNKVLKSKELEGFMNFIMFGFEGHPNKIKRSLPKPPPLTDKDKEDIDQEDQLIKLLDTLKEGNGDVNTLTGSVEKLNNQWKQGAQDGLTKYREGMKDISTRVSDMVVNSFKKMEDALVDFVTGGKLNFRDLANSIIKDMIRIQIQQSITKPLSNFFSSLFTKNANGNVYGQNGIVPFANGGIVTKPTVFPFKNGIGLMGEAGAEAILPLTRRNGKLGVEGGGNNTVVNVSVDASGTEVQGDEQQGRALGQLIAAAVQSELVQQSRPGGILNPA
jgi:tape measure domain-containing protein